MRDLKKKILLITFSILIILLLRYSSYQPLPSDSFPIHTYAVAPQFWGLYAYLGGSDILGPAISEVITNENLSMQYTERVLMVYDPYAPSDRQHYLAPLGKEFGYSDPPVPPQQGGVLYVDGHIIYADFIAIYEEMGGVRYAGKPLTEVLYNPDENRLEQHFENIGIFQSLTDSIGEPELLYYGIEACSHQCRHQPQQGEGFIDPRATLPEPFASTVARLGQTFVGRPISGKRRQSRSHL